MDYKWHKCKQGEMPEDIASPEMIIHRGIKEEYSGYIGNILCYNPDNLGSLKYWIGSRWQGSANNLDSGEVTIMDWEWFGDIPIYWKFIEPVNNQATAFELMCYTINWLAENFYEEEVEYYGKKQNMLLYFGDARNITELLHKYYEQVAKVNGIKYEEENW